MKQDRQFYLDCVREIAYSKGDIEYDYYQPLACSDECSGYCWFKTINQVDIYEIMCACDWIQSKRIPQNVNFVSLLDHYRQSKKMDLLYGYN